VEYLVFFFFCGLSAGWIGRIKGSSFFIWFLIGFCLPLLGTVAALLWRWERDEPMRRCEDCGAIIPVHDQVCMSCGRDLEFPEEVFTLDRSGSRAASDT
jgi:hypothetical protein